MVQLLSFLFAFVHDRLPSFQIVLFELYKVFKISRQEGATRFQVIKYGMAIFAEKYAVDNIIEGKIEESVYKMTGILLEKDSLGWKEDEG